MNALSIILMFVGAFGGLACLLGVASPKFIAQNGAIKTRKEHAQGALGAAVVLLVGWAIYSPDGQKGVKPNPEVSPSDSASQAADVPPPPSHNWAEYKKGVYYYIAAVSENDKKDGRSAGDAVGFRYRGKNSDGDDVVEAMTAIGPIRSTCSDPCSIIHMQRGETIAFEPASIIGEVFTDAENGQLEIYGKGAANAGQ